MLWQSEKTLSKGHIRCNAPVTARPRINGGCAGRLTAPPLDLGGQLRLSLSWLGSV